MGSTAPSVPSFASLWRSSVSECGDRTFLVFEDVDGAVTTFTYERMDRLVDAVAGGLAARGVGTGTSVHLVLPNTVAFVAMWLACSKLGAWFVPSDPRAGVAELAAQIRRTRPLVGVTTTERAADYGQAIGDAGGGVDLVAVDERDIDLDVIADVGLDGPPAVGLAPSAPVSPAQRLAVMFTSGTTSAPKGVLLTQANYAYAGIVMAGAAALRRQDRQLVVLPLFHANAQYYSFASAIAVGASVALMSGFSASRFVEQARRHEATHASLFAAPIRMILARTPEEAEPLSLQHAWFAQNLSTAQYERTARLLGCTPRQLYGMTETVPAVLSNPPIGSRPTSIGWPTLGCAVDLVAGDRGVEIGEEGSIVVGGHPGVTIFAGYLDDPAATEAAVVSRDSDGYVVFDTGDRATVDADGFYHFVGRHSDVLKVAGENVSVVEIEAVLAEHESVADVAVVGRPDEMRDEVPVAYVVAASGAGAWAAVQDDLRRFVSDRLAPAKRPVDYVSVDELPRTSVGKVRRFLLGRGERDLHGSNEGSTT